MQFRSMSSQQMFVFPPTLEELVPKWHLVRVISDVVDQLDLRPLYLSFKEGGRPPYHPKMMLKILFYAYSIGVRSSRKIAQRLESDVCFMYLSGLERPDFRTISDFRKNHVHLLAGFFKQIVLICCQMGMVSVGHISIDGTKIRASASKKRSRDADALQKEIRKLDEQIAEIMAEAEAMDQTEDQQLGATTRGDEIPDELQDKQDRKHRLEEALQLLQDRGWNKINLTDPDSRFMKTSSSPRQLAYNAQVAADSDHQVIIAADVVTDPDDHHYFIPMVEQLKANVGRTPDEVSVDKGYASHPNYKYMQEHLNEVYAPDNWAKQVDNEQDPRSRYTKDKFEYDPENDCFLCPEGRILDFEQSDRRQGIGIRIYRARDCSHCPARAWCLRPTNTSGRRTLNIYETDPYIQQMRQKLKSPEGHRKYQRRLPSVEAPIGNLKYNLQFGQFLLRGLQKVAGEFRLMCIAHNLQKIHRYQLAQLAY